MIKLTRLREEMNLSAKDEGDLVFLRLAVIHQWETLTARKWDAREDYVQTVVIGDLRTQTILLDLWPVDSITSVEMRDNLDDDWTTVDSDRYFVLGRRTLRLIDDWWGQNVRITYDGGVTEADEDVQQSLIAQARFLQSRLSDEKIATQSQNFEGGAGVFLAANVHPLFKMMAKSKSRKA